MNELDKDSWAGRARTLLDESAEGLDAATLSRLNRARQAALAQARPHADQRWFLPAGVASACVLLLAVVAWHSQGPAGAASLPELPFTASVSSPRQRYRSGFQRRQFGVVSRLGVLRVAGCTGSRLGRLTVLAVAWTAAGSAIAQAPPSATAAAAPAQSRDAGKTQGQHGKNMNKSIKVETGPDAALIEYLGEYDDAADGLDPMGLAEPDAVPSKSDGGKG